MKAPLVSVRIVRNLLRVAVVTLFVVNGLAQSMVPGAGCRSCAQEQNALSRTHSAEVAYRGRERAALRCPIRKDIPCFSQAALSGFFSWPSFAAGGVLALGIGVLGLHRQRRCAQRHRERELELQASLSQRTHELEAEIGRHRTTEFALRESESLCRSLLDNLPVNVYQKNLEGKFTFANKLFCQTCGKSPEEVIGKTDYDFSPPALAEKYRSDDQKVLEAQKPLKDIEEHRQSDGTRLYVQVLKVPVRNSRGELTGTQGVFWDVTDRKLAEEALAFERDLLDALLENIPDAVYFKDRESRFLKCSKALVTGLGLTQARMAVGNTDFDFFTEEHARPAFEDEQEIMRSGKPIIGKVERETWTGGHVTWALTTKMPLRNKTGEVIGTFGISKDITSIKEAEEALKTAKEAAEQATRAKSAFLASMSHEIRTPMNGVIGMTNLLLDTSLDSEQRDYAETVRNSAEALLNIINDILDFSKIEAGRLALEVVDFDLREVVEETTELLAERSRQKGIELGSFVPMEVSTRLRGDPGRLRQVLLNLVGNAIKFTEKGEVFVNVTQERENHSIVFLRVEIIDTGIGISYDAQARLFAPFMQADGSTTRKYGGTGLGLAISKQLVELMGGRIGVKSAPGQGSKFWFTLELEKQTDSIETEFEEIRKLANAHILVVDDNATNRRILHHQVLGWRMRGGQAASGAEALVALREAAADRDPYDIAILDMQMPEMDGLMLARTVQADPSLGGIPLIILSSMGQKLSREDMRAGGITSSLIKPVRQSELYDALVNALASAPLPLGRRRYSENAAAPDVPTVFPAPADPVVPQLTLKGPRILVAEDNPVNQKVTLRQLEKLGYTADVVANGLEAIEAIERIPYSVVLMDCHMPDMDGYAATQRIRDRERQGTLNSRLTQPVCIIALTADAMEGDRDRCITGGMDDYVSKPVKIEALQAAIGRAFKPIQEAAAGLNGS